MRVEDLSAILTDRPASRSRHWHCGVFAQDFACARSRLPRLPTSAELDLLLPALVNNHRVTAATEMLSVGVTTAAIRRATGMDVSAEAVSRAWDGRCFTPEERKKADALWRFFFGRDCKEAVEARPEEVARRAEEHFRYYPKKEASAVVVQEATPVCADNLLDLLDALATRKAFTGNGVDVGLLRAEAARLGIKCRFADAYVGNRIREACERARKSAQPLSS